MLSLLGSGVDHPLSIWLPAIIQTGSTCFRSRSIGDKQNAAGFRISIRGAQYPYTAGITSFRVLPFLTVSIRTRTQQSVDCVFQQRPVLLVERLYCRVPHPLPVAGSQHSGYTDQQYDNPKLPGSVENCECLLDFRLRHDWQFSFSWVMAKDWLLAGWWQGVCKLGVGSHRYQVELATGGLSLAVDYLRGGVIHFR